MILQIYILRKFIAAFVWACCLIVGLFVISWFMDELNFFISVSDRTSIKEYILYLLWEIPYTLNFIYPLAAGFAMVYTLGRLHTFNEITAMYNTGKSILHMCYPVMVFIFLLSTLLLIYEHPFLYVTHLKHLEIKKIMMGKETKKKITRSNLTLYGKDNKIYLIGTYEEHNTRMSNVSIIYLDDTNAFSKAISAKTLVYNPQKNLWMGSNVYTRTLNQKDSKLRFRRQQNFDFYEKPSDFETETYDAIDISAKESKRIANKFRIIGGNYRRWDVEYHFKVATPYVPLVVLLLSIPVAVFSKKTNVVLSLLLMTVVSFLFIILIYIGRSMGINEVIPPLAAGWFGHIAFVIFGYFLLRITKLL